MCDSVCSFPSWLCFKYEWNCHSKEIMGSADQYSTIKFQGGRWGFGAKLKELSFLSDIELLMSSLRELNVEGRLPVMPCFMSF